MDEVKTYQITTKGKVHDVQGNKYLIDGNLVHIFLNDSAVGSFVFDSIKEKPKKTTFGWFL